MLDSATTSSFRNPVIRSSSHVEGIAYNDGKGRCFIHIPSKNIAIQYRTKNCCGYQSRIAEEVLSYMLNKYRDLDSRNIKIPEKMALELQEVSIGYSDPLICRVCSLFFNVSCEK